MKRLFLIVSFFVLGFLPWASSYEGGSPDVREEMLRLRSGYIHLETSLAGKQPDYETLKWELERMEGTVRRIQKENRNTKLDSPLKELLSDIRSFQGEVKRKNSSGVENAMTGLYENCFRCHLTHTVHKKTGP